MKAVGWRASDVARVFLLEALVLSLAGGLLGMALLTAAVGGTLAGWVSARRAATLKPAQALRQGLGLTRIAA